MRFLANENILPGAVRRLRDVGHDVVSVRESMAGSGDAAILARAVAEQRVLVTFDKDRRAGLSLETAGQLRRSPVPIHSAEP